MKTETQGKLKYGSWGLIVGTAITMIVGFGWGGWSTAATTQKAAEEAVLTNQAEICIAQFMKQPDHEEKLKELGALDSWKRAEYIANGGWDRMPGQEGKPDHSVSRECAAGLERLMTK